MKKNKIMETIRIISKSTPLGIPKYYGIVSHPLVSDIYARDFDNPGNFLSLTSENIEKYVDSCCNAISEYAKDVHFIFMSLNKPYRLQILDLVQDYITDAEHSKLLRWIWTQTEFPHQMSIRDLVKLFKRALPNVIMTAEERKHLEQLSNIITIYRGLQGPKAKKRGLSWTLSKDKAIWFANRWSKKGKIIQATIKKEFVFMYTDTRNEDEVIINPFHLTKIEEIKE